MSSQKTEKKIKRSARKNPELRGDLYQIWRACTDKPFPFENNELLKWSSHNHREYLKKQLSRDLEETWHLFSPTFGRCSLDFKRFLRHLENRSCLWYPREGSGDAFISFEPTPVGKKVLLMGSRHDQTEVWSHVLSCLKTLLQTEGWWVEASPDMCETLESGGLSKIGSQKKVKKIIGEDIKLWVQDGVYVRNHPKLGSVEKAIFGSPEVDS